jgi:hypothetical protein
MAGRTFEHPLPFKGLRLIQITDTKFPCEFLRAVFQPRTKFARKVSRHPRICVFGPVAQQGGGNADGNTLPSVIKDICGYADDRSPRCDGLRQRTIGSAQAGTKNYQLPNSAPYLHPNGPTPVKFLSAARRLKGL